MSNLYDEDVQSCQKEIKRLRSVVRELENENEDLKKDKTKEFFVTFGSWEGYPFQNGYLIVVAADIEQAKRLYQVFFPNQKPNTLNFADIYSAESWYGPDGAKKYYQAQEPFAILSANCAVIKDT